MQVIVNQEELLAPLAKKILLKKCKQRYKLTFNSLNSYMKKTRKKQNKTGLIEINFSEVNTCIFRDLEIFLTKIKLAYKKNYRPLINWLATNPQLVSKHSKQLLEQYAKPTHTSFLKTIARNITSNLEYITADQPGVDKGFALIRNIKNNELEIATRMDQRIGFWFVDSGYTNFLPPHKKTWNRLVHSHIHQQLKDIKFPADRLHTLPTMPHPWRNNGSKILVVENSESHYQLFGTTRDAWKVNIIRQLTRLTNRPVEFRPKDLNRKTRTNVYEHLTENPNEYYCVISDCSAAAVEAIWAGIPIITLNRHITTPVARTSLKDINDLYYGPLDNWLCALTYSQFTQQELENGNAFRIAEKYHV